MNKTDEQMSAKMVADFTNETEEGFTPLVWAPLMEPTASIKKVYCVDYSHSNHPVSTTPQPTLAVHFYATRATALVVIVAIVAHHHTTSTFCRSSLFTV